ncbi:cyclase family protein [Pseudonocardia sp.]|uniref:cyclase family protein n=2 Tax=Pseudonocardia sp. TaxID=60912 RepID=UPI003D0A0FA0
MTDIPRFADLPFVEGTDERHAWDVWGRDDELGSLNRIGPEQVLAATRLVREGRIIPLSLRLDEPDPGLFASREPYRQTVETLDVGRDDKLDNFYLQYSTQWDGLRHIKFRDHGYWGGRSEEQLDSSDDLGIDRFSRRGPIGRGVLVDVARYRERQGAPLAGDESFAVTGALLDEVARADGIEFRPGDFLVLRTGWLEWYRAQSRERRLEQRGSMNGGMSMPGLDGARETAEWLWDNGITGIAADNLAVEMLPVDRVKGFQHRRLIPLLGMVVGELFHLPELSAYCAESGRYEFLLTSGALPVPRGVGSPANAYAIV